MVNSRTPPPRRRPLLRVRRGVALPRRSPMFRTFTAGAFTAAHRCSMSTALSWPNLSVDLRGAAPDCACGPHGWRTACFCQRLAEAERGAEPLKLALLIAADRDVAVPRRVDTRSRGGPEAKIALASLDDSVLGVAGQLRAHEEERGVEQGDIDTLARRLQHRADQGCESGQRGLGTRHDVHHGNGNSRRLIWRAVQGHQKRRWPGECGRRRAVGEGAGLAEAADRAVHRAGSPSAGHPSPGRAAPWRRGGGFR